MQTMINGKQNSFNFCVTKQILVINVGLQRCCIKTFLACVIGSKVSERSLRESLDSYFKLLF